MQNQRHTLRQQIRNQRQQLNFAEQQITAQKIADLLSTYGKFNNSRHIASYIAINGEVNPEPIIQTAWRQNKLCYLPTLDNDLLQFVLYRQGDKLIPNCFHILEPALKTENILPSTDLDLILVPLVAFDLQGNRLGMGKGYYDKTFAFLLETKNSIKPLLIGLAYEFQKVEQLEKTKWDVPLNAVVTEKGIYNF